MPLFADLPCCCRRGCLAHGSTSWPWWECQQDILTCPGSHWAAITPQRPFSQLAKGARTCPKISEGHRRRQGNYNQEQVKGRSADESTQHRSSFFFLAGMPHLRQLSPSMTSPCTSSEQQHAARAQSSSPAHTSAQRDGQGQVGTARLDSPCHHAPGHRVCVCTCTRFPLHRCACALGQCCNL